MIGRTKRLNPEAGISESHSQAGRGHPTRRGHNQNSRLHRKILGITRVVDGKIRDPRSEVELPEAEFQRWTSEIDQRPSLTKRLGGGL
jgi:hypothetical protein